MTVAHSKPNAKGRYDWGLLTVVSVLMLLGIVMVFSASYPRGMEGFDNPYYFVVRQIVWLAIGVAALIVAARIPYTLWERWSIPIMGVALLSLLFVIIIGAERFGATRTYYNGSIQPSEPAQIAIILYRSAWLTSTEGRAAAFWCPHGYRSRPHRPAARD